MIGREYPRLTDFRLVILREGDHSSRARDAIGLSNDRVCEHCRIDMAPWRVLRSLTG